MKLDRPTDEQLIAGCIEGRPDSWRLFVERFAGLIHASVRHALEGTPARGRKDLAEDAFQETFRRLIEKDTLSKLREVERARAFLAVLACRAAFDRAKAAERAEAKREKPSADGLFDPLEEIASKASDPALGALERERDGILGEALESLGPRERTCIELHYLEGETHRRISEVLGMPQNTVSTVIRRTRDKLRALLVARGWEGPDGR